MIGRRRALETMLVAGGLAGVQRLGFAQTPKRFKAVYASRAPGGPLWVAEEKARFRAHGLDPELVSINNTPGVVEATVSGESPISYAAGADVLEAAIAGRDFVFIAGAVNTLVYDLVVHPSIAKPADLKGKSIGITRLGELPDVSMRLALARKWQLQPDKDVTIRQMGDIRMIMIGFRGGQIQAAPMTADARLRAEKVGLKKLVSLSSLGIEYQHTALFSTRSFLKKDEDAVRRFLKAFVDGIHIFRTDKAAAVAAVTKFTGAKNPEEVDAHYKEYADLFLKVPYPTLSGIKTILDQIAKKNPQAGKAKPEDFVDSRFVRELETSGYIDRLYKGA